MYKIMIRNQLAKIHDPTVETRLKVCSNGHAPLTVMPIYGKIMIVKKKQKTYFFKIKNCSNNDPFISCNEGLEKCYITSAYLQWLFHSGERALACGPLVQYLG